ncbi:major facilitator superfamily domain-containing protein [Desarmillaria tabescens]|uniref:Major facilitator superfamily domain-containing protein n=1 Tax=Armillaria tabescens TaxID=1929756 RepID=A0AA39J656_ARMTA|nr:major facilitator superfamily domain-containing protein [Desarmillaria tabescens]KAK0436793.1 major facilitator superfamily domain-containing protein [Desarmillaria tabescens]
MAPSLDSKPDRKDDVESNVPDVAYGPNGEPSHNIEDYYRFDPKVEQRVVRKLDARLMPLIFCLYILNAMDRSNLGNAKTDGLETDLHFHENDYSIMLSVFCAVKNFVGCLVVRLFLGAAEAGFALTIIWYLTTFYTRGELGKRVAVFFSALAFAGGFSGLIAYGVFQPDIRLQGAATVFFSILAIFILPANIDSALFFSSDEKHVARTRILRDSSAVMNEKLTSQAFFAPLEDWKLYVWALIAICYGVASSLTGTFLPQIIGRMGKSKLTTNLLTARTVIVLFIIRDVLSFIVLDTVDVSKTGIQYFGSFLLCLGAFTPSTVFHVRHNCNDASEVGRGFRTALMTFFANSSGLIASNIFMEKEQPYYNTALVVNFSFLAVGISLVLSLRGGIGLTRNMKLRPLWVFYM